jgi:hypothetical protein
MGMFLFFEAKTLLSRAIFLYIQNITNKTKASQNLNDKEKGNKYPNKELLGILLIYPFIFY